MSTFLQFTMNGIFEGLFRFSHSQFIHVSIIGPLRRDIIRKDQTGDTEEEWNTLTRSPFPQSSTFALISNTISPPFAMSSCCTIGTSTFLPLIVNDLMYGFDGASFATILRIRFFSLSASLRWGCGGRSIVTLSKNGLDATKKIQVTTG